MGRKSQSKQISKKNSGKENKFLQQKRRELALLVDKLLRLTSIFQATGTVSKSWEHHLEVDNIIKEVINLEAPQYRSTQITRQANIDKYIKWLQEHEVQFDGKT